MKQHYKKSNMTITRNVDVTFEITENDVFNWLTQCDDPDTLERLGKTCLKYAHGLRDPDDDDFRSRA